MKKKYFLLYFFVFFLGFNFVNAGEIQKADLTGQDVYLLPGTLQTDGYVAESIYNNDGGLLTSFDINGYNGTTYDYTGSGVIIEVNDTLFLTWVDIKEEDDSYGIYNLINTDTGNVESFYTYEMGEDLTIKENYLYIGRSPGWRYQISIEDGSYGYVTTTDNDYLLDEQNYINLGNYKGATFYINGENGLFMLSGEDAPIDDEYFLYFAYSSTLEALTGGVMFSDNDSLLIGDSFPRRYINSGDGIHYIISLGDNTFYIEAETGDYSRLGDYHAIAYSSIKDAVFYVDDTSLYKVGNTNQLLFNYFEVDESVYSSYVDINDILYLNDEEGLNIEYNDLEDVSSDDSDDCSVFDYDCDGEVGILDGEFLTGIGSWFSEKWSSITSFFDNITEFIEILKELFTTEETTLSFIPKTYADTIASDLNPSVDDMEDNILTKWYFFAKSLGIFVILMISLIAFASLLHGKNTHE